MGNGAVALIAASLTAVAVLLIVWLISFIRRFNSDTEYYYWKMQTADTKKNTGAGAEKSAATTFVLYRL